MTGEAATVLRLPAGPARRTVRGRRACALLDLENLLHDARDGADGELLDRFAGIVRTARRVAGEVWVTGCGDRRLVRRLLPAAYALDVRLHPGPAGPDRADRELLQRLAWDVPSSCDVVVIGSGDRIFSGPAERLRAGGREVVVICGPGQLSLTLARTADRVIEFSSAARRTRVRAGRGHAAGWSRPAADEEADGPLSPRVRT